MTITLNLSPEAIEAIARRAAELVAEQACPTDDGWLRGADKIAAYIDAKPDRVYELSSTSRIPVEATTLGWRGPKRLLSSAAPGPRLMCATPAFILRSAKQPKGAAK